MTPIADAWSEFERMVLQSGVSDVQREEMRKAFYAGAIVAFSHLVATSNQSHDEAVELFECYSREIEAYGSEINARVGQA